MGETGFGGGGDIPGLPPLNETLPCIHQEPMSRPKGGEGASKYTYSVLLIMHKQSDHTW